MNVQSNKRKRRILSAEEKWRIYQLCQQPGAKIGEILRSHALYSSDLQKIRKSVEKGALENLRQSHPGHKKHTSVSIEEHARLQRELDEKEKALAEMTVLFTTLNKKIELEITGPFPSSQLPPGLMADIVQMVAYAKDSGIPRGRTCAVIQINRRRVERWALRLRETGSIQNRKPGPAKTRHALLP